MTPTFPPEGQHAPQWGASQGPSGPPRKKRRKWPWIVGLGVLPFGVVVANTDKPSSSSTTVPTAPTVAAPAPNVGTVTAPASVAPATPAAVTPVGPAKAISARQWQLIAKDPDAHSGERIIVFGEVTQFDAATGTGGFRANVDGVEHKPKYGFADYKTNTVVTGDAELLKDVVDGDLFKAEATVVGAYTYTTTLGGQLTVPKIEATKITVIGHV